MANAGMAPFVFPHLCVVYIKARYYKIKHWKERKRIMRATATCRIIFSGAMEKLEKVMDYLEKIQRGEYFLDDETETLELMIEEDLELSNKEEIIAFVDRLYKRFKKKVNVHAIGTLNAINSGLSQKFECQYTSNFFRYRETDWSHFEVDENLSYEEYEEENYMDIDEDEYDEYMHRAHDGIQNDEDDVFGDWDYID